MRSLLDDLRADLRIYSEDGPWYAQSGFWATATYRIGAQAHRLESKPARYGLLLLHKALATPWQVIKGVHIASSAKIAGGFRMPHPQNILIPSESEIGPGCSVYQDVTIGRGPVPGVPRFGRGVMLYPGARVLGGVELGDHAIVGANCVVTRDVEGGAVITVAPARVIPSETAERFLHTRGKVDPQP